MISLKEFVEKYTQFQKVFSFLEKYLEEKAENIEVYSFDKANEFRIRETVNAFVLRPDKVYFRHIPPDLYTFTHELIHLCKKPGGVDEELYGYNLVEAVIYAAENDIKVNIFKLFKLKRKDIEKVLKCFRVNSVEEFYQLIGVVPATHEVIQSEDGLKIVQKEEITEDAVVSTFITEIVAGLEYDHICEKIFRRILEDLSK